MADRYEEYAGRQFEEQYRQFYCGAPPSHIPGDILRVVMHRMGQKFRDLRTFNPMVIAPVVEEAGLITYEQFYAIRNPHTRLPMKLDELNEGLYHSGKQAETLVRFYHCLIDSACHCPTHAHLAREMRQHALVICGLPHPIIASEDVTGVSGSQTLHNMIEKLQGVSAPEDIAMELAKNLELSSEDIPGGQTDSSETYISDICRMWMTKKGAACTPEKLVEALVISRSLGRHASGLCYPSNPPGIEGFFISLREEWVLVANFLGYTAEDSEALGSGKDNNPDQQIRNFLTLWEMPDCGPKTLPILHKLARLAGVVSRGAPKRRGHRMLTTMQQSLKVRSREPHDGGRPLLATSEDQWSSLLKDSLLLKERSAFLADVEELHLEFAQQVHMRRLAILRYGREDLKCLEGEGLRPSCWDYDMMEADRLLPLLDVQLKPQTSTSEYTESTALDKETEGSVSTMLSPTRETGSLQVPESVCSSGDGAYRHSRQLTGLNFIRDDSDILIQSCKDPNGLDMVKALIESGKKLTVQQASDGAHPIHLAVKCGSLEMAVYLLEHDCLVDAITDNHQTPLMFACQEKNLAFVKLFVEKGADVNAKDCNGYCCLHYKETLESTDILIFLIEKGGARVDIHTDGDCLTPLTRACLSGDSTCNAAKYLLSHRADPDGLPNAHIRPLTAASAGGHEELVKLLLNQGASVNLRDKDGSTAVLRAAQRRHANIVGKLINAHADLNLYDKNGTTPVMAAVEYNSREILELLLVCNAKVNHPKLVGTDHSFQLSRGYEMTPLALAAAKGHKPLVEMLVTHNADVNFCSDRTLPPLAFAVIGGQTHIVEYLLKLNELRKGLEDMRVPLLSAVEVGNHYIAQIILNEIGGQEKVLVSATEAGMEDLANHLCQLDEMRGGKSSSYEAPSSAPRMDSRGGAQWMPPAATEDVPLALTNPEQMHRYMVTVLEDFAQIAIAVVAEDTGQDFLIEEARRSGYYDVMQFFEQYFADARCVGNLFGEFIRGQPSPAQFIFSTGRFSGTKFADRLYSMGRIRLMEEVEIALMTFPAVETTNATGDTLLKGLFGQSFFKTITLAGLPTASNPRNTPPEPAALVPRDNLDNLHTLTDIAVECPARLQVADTVSERSSQAQLQQQLPQHMQDPPAPHNPSISPHHEQKHCGQQPLTHDQMHSKQPCQPPANEDHAEVALKQPRPHPVHQDAGTTTEREPVTLSLLNGQPFRHEPSRMRRGLTKPTPPQAAKTVHGMSTDVGQRRERRGLLPIPESSPDHQHTEPPKQSLQAKSSEEHSVDLDCFHQTASQSGASAAPPSTDTAPISQSRKPSLSRQNSLAEIQPTLACIDQSASSFNTNAMCRRYHSLNYQSGRTNRSVSVDSVLASLPMRTTPTSLPHGIVPQSSSRAQITSANASSGHTSLPALRSRSTGSISFALPTTDTPHSVSTTVSRVTESTTAQTSQVSQKVSLPSVAAVQTPFSETHARLKSTTTQPETHFHPVPTTLPHPLPHSVVQSSVFSYSTPRSKTSTVDFGASSMPSTASSTFSPPASLTHSPLHVGSHATPHSHPPLHHSTQGSLTRNPRLRNDSGYISFSLDEQPIDPSAEGVEELLKHIATRVPNWQELARGLDVSQETITLCDEETEGEQCHKMLETWTQMGDRQATYAQLLEALQQIGKEDLCQYVRKHMDQVAQQTQHAHSSTHYPLIPDTITWEYTLYLPSSLVVIEGACREANCQGFRIAELRIDFGNGKSEMCAFSLTQRLDILRLALDNAVKEGHKEVQIQLSLLKL